jgi:hypothetical protein
MNQPQTQADLESQIVLDLMRKVADDVEAVINRTLDIAPEGSMPIAVQAAAAAIARLATVIRCQDQAEPFPARQLIMLAALMAARGAIEEELYAAIDEAERDMRALHRAGRIV